MAILSKFQRGETITAERLNQMIDAIQECQIQSVVGGYFKRGPGGSTITIPPQKRVAGGPVADETCPFEMSLTATAVGFEISVQPGTINGVIPSKILSVITATTGSTSYVCIDCYTDGKSVVTAEIAVKTTVPNPPLETADTAPTFFSYPIGIVTNSTIYRTIGCSNITVPIIPTFSVDNETYVAGLRNFTQYYTCGL